MKNSALSTLSAIFAIFTFTLPIAVILAIVDLSKKDKTKKHTGSWFAIIFAAIFFIIIMNPSKKEDNKNNQQNNSDTEQITENIQQNTENEKTETENETAEKEEYEQKEVIAKEILFNDIPWGTSFTEVEEKLGTWDLWNISGEGYKTYSADDILLGDYNGIDFEYSGINIISNAFNGEQEVAGYTTEDITLYFAYLPIDGYLTYEEKDTALYGAQYVFKPVDLQATYDDLTLKLTNIYGEPSKTTNGSDIWGNQYTYTYWHGANNTELVIKGLNSENDTTDLYDDEICLSYVWRVGDELLQNASDAVRQERLDKENNAREENNNTGL